MKRLTNSQMKRARTVVTSGAWMSVSATPPQLQQVFLGLLLDDVDDVVDGDDAEQPAGLVDHRRRDQVVAAGTGSATFSWSIVDRDRLRYSRSMMSPIFTGRLRADQLVERHPADRPVLRVDDVDVVEIVGQVVAVAYVVDASARRSRTAAPRRPRAASGGRRFAPGRRAPPRSAGAAPPGSHAGPGAACSPRGLRSGRARRRCRGRRSPRQDPWCRAGSATSSRTSSSSSGMISTGNRRRSTSTICLRCSGHSASIRSARSE